jgi:hypothetical protein
MKRRELITLLGVAAASWPRASSCLTRIVVNYFNLLEQ